MDFFKKSISKIGYIDILNRFNHANLWNEYTNLKSGLLLSHNRF